MEEYLNKKVKGFEFSGAPNFTPSMKTFVGKIGRITSCRRTNYIVQFDNGTMYAYPYPEILKHLVEDESVNLDDILEQIKKLKNLIMKDEDIIGREIVCFKFENDERLKYTDIYKQFEGLTGTVINLHYKYPEYANVEVNLALRKEKWHYPTELIKKQVEELDELNEVVDLNDILLQIKKLNPLIMTVEKELDIVRALVSDYFDKHGEQLLPAYLRITEKEHIVYIGTSVLCSKWKVGYPGGDFVKAIVDNDLSAAFSRADHINEHCVKFYLMLMYNVEMPTSLLEKLTNE